VLAALEDKFATAPHIAPDNSDHFRRADERHETSNEVQGYSSTNVLFMPVSSELS